MLNGDRISKNTADLLSIRAEVERLLSAGRDAFLADRKNPLAVKYLLIEAVEAITDVCQHILAKKNGVVCNGYVDCIVKAGEHGIIDFELSKKLRKLADLRNSLIHRYWVINDGEIFDQCNAHIMDLSDFVAEVNRFSP